MNNSPKLNLEKRKSLGGAFISPLAKALRAFVNSSYGDDAPYDALEGELKKIWGKLPGQVKTADEFLDKRLLRAIKELVGKQWCLRIRDMVMLCSRCQFSQSMMRRSYHSSFFGYYTVGMLYNIRNWIELTCYDVSPEEMIRRETDSVRGFRDFAALKLSENDPVFVNTAREMILGDNNAVLLSRTMITAIIMSDNGELKDLLLKLLLAAKNQEGLRQSILESADAGDLDTFKKIYRCCMDNDLFRFTSAARALYTWAGIYLEDIDIKTTRRIAATGWECLTDPRKREEYMDSKDPFRVYFALWAKGCEDAARVDGMLDSLLDSPDLSKKYVGWYFVSGIGNERFRHSKAIEHLQEEDISVIACATDNLHVNRKACYAYTYSRTDYSARAFPDPIYDGDAGKRRELFRKLKVIVLRIGDREWKYDGYLFPWSRMVINQKNAEALRCMFSLAACDLDPEMIDQLYSVREYMDTDLRRSFYINFLDPDINEKHRQYLYDGLKDRSIYNKQAAIEKLRQCYATKEDIRNICALLSSRSSSLKQSVMAYLKALKASDREYGADLLLGGDENSVQAACELLLESDELLEKFRGRVDALKERSFKDQTAVLVEQLTRKADRGEDEGRADGLKYGLYSEDTVLKAAQKCGRIRSGELLTEKQLLAMYPSEKEMTGLIERLMAVFDSHADYEYETEGPGGAREKILFGDVGEYWSGLRYPAQYGETWRLKQSGTARLSMVPFGDEFRDILQEYIDDPPRMAMLCYAADMTDMFGEKQSWFKPFIDRFFVNIKMTCYRKYGNSYGRCLEIIGLGMYETDTQKAADTLITVYFSLCRILKEENLSKNIAVASGPYIPHYAAGSHGIFADLRRLITRHGLSDSSFERWFAGEYYLARSQDFGFDHAIDLDSCLRAVEAKLIPADCLCDLILSGDSSSYVSGPINVISSPSSQQYRQYAAKYPWFTSMAENLIDKAVRYEAKRGQSETPISSKMRGIGRFEGMEYFVMLLKALGNDSFFRGYAWSSDTSKTTILSMLLRKCSPAKGDDPKSLGELLKSTDIKEKRLIEAAMYAPQWSGIIEEIIGWPGLKKAVWFFHAHVSEHFSPDKETEVALYSPISPQSFNDGAFDVDWFNDVYSQLGEKKFKTLYSCAKYLTEGSNAHRRSQLYTDAVTGKLDPKELEKEILEKRNQEKIRAYGLIPVAEGELLHRYLFITRYIKESKKFGAQRRENEKKAAAVALENLAISSGYMDVNRMLWRLEGEQNREILPLLEKKTVEEYGLSIALSEKGEPSLLIEKNGKVLRSAPKSLAKNEYLEELKTVVRELRDQRTRGKNTLEASMINKTGFGMAELESIMSSVTVAPLAKDLLWRRGSDIGYPGKSEKGFTLTDFEGTVTEIGPDDRVVIVHPHDLFTSGQWSNYIHQACSDRLVQPFKQIFREYYPLTDEEREERMLSRRYSGYQVQPQKTASLLKSRGWTVDYEEGLQRVFYDDGILVRLYSQADWFSPADIESPTLEEIRFFDRKSGEPVPLEKVDPVVFSEIMRDIDLAVSVAYVGGVDAETSHSTVEMRVAIAKELVLLLKLSNVEFTERHARIRGSLADYSVHMGSGIVHAGSRGMIPIVPVHSQHRGRIFLPFADEDPKTAEIMSKIILLAEDTKIKDPEILSRLR